MRPWPARRRSAAIAGVQHVLTGRSSRWWRARRWRIDDDGCRSATARCEVGRRAQPLAAVDATGAQGQTRRDKDEEDAMVLLAAVVMLILYARTHAFATAVVIPAAESWYRS